MFEYIQKNYRWYSWAYALVMIILIVVGRCIDINQSPEYIKIIYAITLLLFFLELFITIVRIRREYMLSFLSNIEDKLKEEGRK